MMSLLEKLKTEFPTRVCPPYGVCIVIPGDKFHPNWEGELDVDVINTDFGDPNKPVTLVPLKGEQESKEQFEDSTPIEPPKPIAAIEPKQRKHTLQPRDWTPKDIERLLKRWSEVKGLPMQRAEKLAPEFPNRKPEAIYQKHWALETGYNFNRRRQKATKNTKKNMPRPIIEKAPKTESKKNETEPVIREESLPNPAQKLRVISPIGADYFEGNCTGSIMPNGSLVILKVSEDNAMNGEILAMYAQWQSWRIM